MSSSLSGQAEVGDLEHFRSVTQQILWLQISVEESLAMHVGQALEKLTDEVGDDVVGKRVAILDELVQVLRHVFEHKVENIVFPNHLWLASGERMKNLKKIKVGQ